MTTLARLPDWPERLAAYLCQQRPNRFAWGTHDCANFAAGAVLAVTGCQVLQLQWAGAADAVRLLRTLGGLQAAVDRQLPRLQTAELAQRGDVVLAQQLVAGGRARRQFLAVADGARWWAPSVTGLHSGPMAAAATAWGVGHG